MIVISGASVAAVELVVIADCRSYTNELLLHAVGDEDGECRSAACVGHQSCGCAMWLCGVTWCGVGKRWMQTLVFEL